MARIDFAFGARNRLRTACETVQKNYLAGHKLLVYTQNQPLMQRFDRLLWGFESSAFIPHVYHDDPLAAQSPVLLYTSARQPAGLTDAWLLNLDALCPPGAAQFTRILEIVSQEPDDIRAARQRWKAYQQEGHQLHAHDLSKLG